MDVIWLLSDSYSALSQMIQYTKMNEEQNSSLELGYAVKIRLKADFSKDVKDYLTQLYEQRNRTGRKADA
jgi:hypothetical protein